MYNTPALLILIGILFEMFSLEATRLSYINKKTVREILVTVIGTTAMYVLFLTLGWLVGKYFLKGFNLFPLKYLLCGMIAMIIIHAILQERRKLPASGALLYQNQLLYFGIVLAKSIIHIISGAIFYKMDLFTHVFFNWILISTTVFSLISIVLTYPSMRIFGFSIGKLKILLYIIAFIIVLLFIK